jgi:aryl-alcohol dehydrogenase-like predicted oxidoreductase
MTTAFAHAPASLRLGDLEVRRLGFGAMRLPGKDVWGEPSDPDHARAVLRRAIDLGVNFIDTAWYYGPFVANRLLVEALHPYPSDLVIATKLGGMRRPDKTWGPYARPEELRKGCEDDLRSLRLERLDVVHLRFMPSSGVPFLESLDAMVDLQKEGKIRHLALSNVSVREMDAADGRAEIVAVQNLYNVAGGGGRLAKMTHAEVEAPDEVLARCEARSIAYLPFFPLAIGGVSRERPIVDTIAARRGVTPAQIAIAWLLARSKVMLPIPGTSRVDHLEENWKAREIELSDEEVQAIAAGA